MGVVIASELIAKIVAAAQASPAAEVCGLLLGPPRHAGLVPASTSPRAPSPDRLSRGGCRDEPGMTWVESIRPCSNLAADPARRFEIDPAALLAAHRAARGGGPAVVGHYHSHPAGDPTPSPRDAADAAPDGSLWLIVGADDVRVWRAVPDGVVHDRFDPVSLRVGPALATGGAILRGTPA